MEMHALSDCLERRLIPTRPPSSRFHARRRAKHNRNLVQNARRPADIRGRPRRRWPDALDSRPPTDVAQAYPCAHARSRHSSQGRDVCPRSVGRTAIRRCRDHARVELRRRSRPATRTHAQALAFDSRSATRGVRTCAWLAGLPSLRERGRAEISTIARRKRASRRTQPARDGWHDRCSCIRS